MKIGVLQQVGSNLYISVEKFLEVKIHAFYQNFKVGVDGILKPAVCLQIDCC